MTQTCISSTPLTAPSLSLPPLGRLAEQTTERITLAMRNLQHIYFPTASSSSVLSIPKRNIKHTIHDTSVPDSGYASAEEDDDDEALTTEISVSGEDTQEADELLRADPFERAFAIKWVTGFVTRSDDWVAAAISEEESKKRSSILDEATVLLSSFVGGEDEEDVALTRTFSFPGGIHVELNDAPLSKDDHTSVGLQSWGSSILLADRFCSEPEFFSLAPRSGDKPLRILELGAGTGMLSIVASKILQGSSVEIVATDYHPDVLENLRKNVATNFSSSTSITVTALDWENPYYEAPFDKPFDIILAADVIYHPSHAKWIKDCVGKLLDRSPGAEAVFWLIIPVRTTGRHEGMDATVDALFVDDSSSSSGPGKLAILHREEVGRQGSVGRADEGAYKLFKIGWVN
ncbi:hypothetical protein D9613_004373 [Agrocybe pediades]|uniref:S-adenosylmethionine-dependent methyltransferase n=1 Tax=Agrocybe pediades TaxID=84607 RepID=A0A8H4VJS9_9AGAR|nr:hypothetical protein D9613_004373 [Agrocybe pediades]